MLPTQSKNKFKRTRRPWLKEDKEKLKDLNERGLTHREIAGILGRTIGSVSSKISQLGLSKDNIKIVKRTKKELNEVIRLKEEEGKPFEEIAKEIKRPLSTVREKYYVATREKRGVEGRAGIGIGIEGIREEIKLGAKVKAPYTISMKTAEKRKGKVVGKNKHHFTVKFKCGIRESYTYFDSKEVEKCL